MQRWDEKFFSKLVDSDYSETIATTKAGFGTLALDLETKLPNGRYKSLVLTKLEEAAMFATKAITHRELGINCEID